MKKRALKRLAIVLGAGLCLVAAAYVAWWPAPAPPPKTRPICCTDSIKPILADVSIDSGHRWYIVFKSTDKEPLKLINDPELIRSYKDRVMYKTNSLNPIFDGLSFGPHVDWDFFGFKIYRDGEIWKRLLVGTVGRFDFGPLAEKGIPVWRCGVRASRKKVRPLLTEDTAAWLYPDGPAWTPDDPDDDWAFYFFIQPKDWERVKSWPGIECRHEPAGPQEETRSGAP